MFKLWSLTQTCGRGFTPAQPMESICAHVLYDILLNCCHVSSFWAAVNLLWRLVEMDHEIMVSLYGVIRQSTFGPPL